MAAPGIFMETDFPKLKIAGISFLVAYTRRLE